jgi:hypothetical protein
LSHHQEGNGGQGSKGSGCYLIWFHDPISYAFESDGCHGDQTKGVWESLVTFFIFYLKGGQARLQGGVFLSRIRRWNPLFLQGLFEIVIGEGLAVHG